MKMVDCNCKCYIPEAAVSFGFNSDQVVFVGGHKLETPVGKEYGYDGYGGNPLVVGVGWGANLPARGT